MANSTSTASEKSGERRKKILIGLGAVAAFAVTYFIYEHMAYVSTENAQVEAPSVLLAPKVSGFVVKVNVTDGQKVKTGDVLVELDDRDYANTLKQVKAELASMAAKRDDTEKNNRRISGLYKGDAVSQQQFDQASTAFTEARSKYEALSAQVAQAELNLENTKIKAPANGVIAKKSVEVGQLASVGSPLIGFVGSDERWVVANFKETELDGILVGHKADIDVDALKSRRFEGTIENLSAATGATFALLPPDNATGNFTKVVQRVPVRIRFENLTDADREVLRAGLSATVRVHKR